MRRLLTILASVLALTGAMTWASPAYAADSLGWDSGMKCFYSNLHFSIVKVQWAYHVSNGVYVYKPYAVHVLEADGAHHQTVNAANMNLLIDQTHPAGQTDTWRGPTTYTFGPTRLSHITSYSSRGRVTLNTTLFSPDGRICYVDNSP